GIDGVVSSLVQVIGDSAADKQLVAWVVFEKDNPPTREVLRTELAARVPEHMVPGFFLLLDDWPLTAVGKIDRRALPTPDALSQQDEYIAPADEIEKRLAGLWADLLEVPVDELSVTANFFVIGGHSLLAVRMLSQVKQQLGTLISVARFWQHQSIRALAKLIEQNIDLTDQGPLVRLNPGDGGALTPVFCIPGAGGNAAEFAHIATSLTNRAVWGLQPSGLDGTVAADSITMMATGYVDAMIAQGLSHRPVLIGHSMGAAVACAMAQRLGEHSLTPLQLIIIDAEPPGEQLRRSPPAEQIEQAFHLLTYRWHQSIRGRSAPINIDSVKLTSLAQQNPDKALEYLLEQLHGARAQPDDVAAAKQVFSTYRKHLNAFARYHVDAPLKLHGCQVHYVAADKTARDKTDAIYARWQKIFSNSPGGVGFSSAEGDHFGVLQGPDVALIARLVSSYFQTTESYRAVYEH
ncbi:alpha/beta fold hydrolase, partial [Microbulbifer sp. 2304DJ12-6]|uniref:alpha/beta fold hydrolase n=1 Tax=Microbulbifer sp. 2304DJ12-6 TaxID=3233340 RepID=UPI0039AED4F3